MAWQLHRDDLEALSDGCSLLGSGGGGSPRLARLALATAMPESVAVHDVDEVPPGEPWVAVGFAGSIVLLGERLPDPDPFAGVLATLEGWAGRPLRVALTMEAGGLNGLSALYLAGSQRLVVDADLTGRALPDIDQMSVLVDGVPVALACWSGGAGVVTLQGSRPRDAERLVRTAVATAGGWTVMAIAGRDSADLRVHAQHGSTARALRLGRAHRAHRGGTPEQLATALGAALWARGRVEALVTAPDRTIELVVRASATGPVVRLVARDEVLACLVDGEVVAATPTVIDVVDDRTLDVLEVHELTVGRHVAVLSLPAPTWWLSPHRLPHVRPERYGLCGLDTPAAVR